MDTEKRRLPSRENLKTLLSAMKLLMGLIFIGSLMVWILSPTYLWRKDWQLRVEMHTNSTYFGKQGTYFLLYTVPILLIAALGCVYLHLGKKGSNDHKASCTNAENNRLSKWEKPILVKGPFGVVSALELTFLTMFVTLLIWTFATRQWIRFHEIDRGINHRHRDHRHDNDKKWQLKMRTSAYNLGLVGNICCAFLFFPVTRGSSILPLVGLTSEASIKYHIWLGHMAMVLFTAHGGFYTFYWAITNDLVELLKWDKVGVSNVAGEIALLTGIVMWVTVFPRIRRKKFELFFYTHQLYLLFLLFYVLHVGFVDFSNILPGIYLFLIDRYIRFLQSRQKVRLVSARVLPCDTLELNFSRSPGLVYTPTSVMFINVPSISSLQWHPFTVSSNSDLEPDSLSIIIKKEGSWSNKLYQMLSSPLDHLDVSVEGPYGPASVDFLRHDTLVMVSGGSGIAPMISIIRDLIYKATSLSSPTPRIFLISAFKTSSDLTMLDLLLPMSSNSNLSYLNLHLDAFVTRENSPPPTDTYACELVHTFYFKPLPSDAPISPVLGQNSWLCLGAVIITSFIAFLILLGMLTRYYIYPIDWNTEEIYSTSSRAVLSTLIMCFSIAAMASAAVFWNKRQYSKEVKQTQSLEMCGESTTSRQYSKHIKSTSSWFSSVDNEVESLPLQCLVQRTKVHYGARPNLSKMLLEIKGSSIGVLVSGPKEMRHDVASICSSVRANHLHFEAISFNW